MFLYNNYNKNPEQKIDEKNKGENSDSSISEPQNIEDMSNNESEYEDTENKDGEKDGEKDGDEESSSNDDKEVCKPPTTHPTKNLTKKERNRNLDSILSPRLKNYGLNGFFETDSEIDSDIGSEESDINSDDDYSEYSYDIKNSYTDEQPKYVICIDGIPYGSVDNEKDAEYYTWKFAREMCKICPYQNYYLHEKRNNHVQIITTNRFAIISYDTVKHEVYYKSTKKLKNIKKY